MTYGLRRGCDEAHRPSGKDRWKAFSGATRPSRQWRACNANARSSGKRRTNANKAWRRA
jgi:hypothetical protein